MESEILSRTNPTLIDFGIAMAAGFAGAFTQTRRSIADAIPGVAIAVALVPPLSVIGIGLGLREQEVATGAFLLFSTNLICIIFFGSLVFLFQSYGNLERAKKGLAMSTVVMFALGVPLTLSMRDLILKKNISSQISDLIVKEATVLDDVEINLITVIPHKKYLQVKIDVGAPLDSISQEDIDSVRKLLDEKINQPVDLRVEIIPLRVIESSDKL